MSCGRGGEVPYRAHNPETLFESDVRNVKNKHWVYKVGATLGLLVLADYDIGGIVYIIHRMGM